MPITFANLGASTTPDMNLTTNLTSYSNTSWTPPTSGLLIVFTFNAAATAGAAIAPTVTGNSITYTQIATVINNVERISLFAAKLAGATAGTTTFDFGSNSQTCCKASFFHVIGADLSGTTAQAFVQQPTNSGAAATTGTVTLSAAASAANRPIAGFYHFANEATTPRTNWTEADDLALGTPAAAMETQYRSDAFETTASATWASSVIWAAIAAEVKAARSDPLPSRPTRMWRKRRTF